MSNTRIFINMNYAHILERISVVEKAFLGGKPP
jgi:hypothetical protein